MGWADEEAEADRLRALEARVEQLKSQVKQEYGDDQRQINDIKNHLKLNGFISAAAEKLDGNSDASLYGVGNTLNTNSHSVVGVQLIAKTTDKYSFTIQLISHGLEYHDTKTEWAYISYLPTRFDLIQAGRFRFPYYLLSQYLEVGFAYPWVHPPVEVYNLNNTTLDGFQWTHFENLASWDNQFSAYLGRSLAEEHQFNGVDFALDRAWGVSWLANKGEWTVRLGYNAASVNVSKQFPGGNVYDFAQAINQINDASKLLNSMNPAFNLRTDFEAQTTGLFGAYESFALQYDDFSWLMMAELAHLQVDKSTQPAGDSGYILLGRRFGSWMPHITFSKFYTDKKNEKFRQDYANGFQRFADALTTVGQADQANAVEALITRLNLLNQAQQSYTLGVNYDLTSSAKLKLDVTQYEGFQGSHGRFDGDPGSRTTLYSFAIDAVF